MTLLYCNIYCSCFIFVSKVKLGPCFNQNLTDFFGTNLSSKMQRRLVVICRSDIGVCPCLQENLNYFCMSLAGRFVQWGKATPVSLVQFRSCLNQLSYLLHVSCIGGGCQLANGWRGSLYGK